MFLITSITLFLPSVHDLSVMWSGFILDEGLGMGKQLSYGMVNDILLGYLIIFLNNFPR